MNVWKDITGGTEGKDACVLSRRAQWRRRTLGTLCSIRRGNNSSAHVNQEFRTPLILRGFEVWDFRSGCATDMKRETAPPARRGWPRSAAPFTVGASATAQYLLFGFCRPECCCGTTVAGACDACNAGEIEPDRRRLLLFHLGSHNAPAAPYHARSQDRRHLR